MPRQSAPERMSGFLPFGSNSLRGNVIGRCANKQGHNDPARLCKSEAIKVLKIRMGMPLTDKVFAIILLRVCSRVISDRPKGHRGTKLALQAWNEGCRQAEYAWRCQERGELFDLCDYRQALRHAQRLLFVPSAMKASSIRVLGQKAYFKREGPCFRPRARPGLHKDLTSGVLKHTRFPKCASLMNTSKGGWGRFFPFAARNST